MEKHLNMLKRIIWMFLVFLTPILAAGNCNSLEPLPKWDKIPDENRERWKHGFPRSVTLDSLLPSDLKVREISKIDEKPVLQQEIVLKRHLELAKENCLTECSGLADQTVRCIWSKYSDTGFVASNAHGPVAIGNAEAPLGPYGIIGRGELHKVYPDLNLPEYPWKKIVGLLEAFFLEACQLMIYEECPDVCGTERCTGIQNGQQECLANTKRMPNIAVYEDEFKCKCDAGFHWDKNIHKCLIGPEPTTPRTITFRPGTPGSDQSVNNGNGIQKGTTMSMMSTVSAETNSSNTIGAVVGVLLMVIVLACILTVFYCKKKKPEQAEDETQLIDNNQSRDSLKIRGSVHSRASSKLDRP